MGRRSYALLLAVGLVGVLTANASARLVGAAAPTVDPPSCRAILAGNPSAATGVYTIDPTGSSPYDVYCDMTTDGGGWTAIFAGKNGSPNVFDHFDAGSYNGTFTDPATLYLRRAPAIPAAAELAVSCASAMVKFALTEPARAWMTSGAQAGWINLTPTVIAGAPPNIPNTLWTGVGADLSFIFARNQGGFGNTFASSYAGSTFFDYCDGVFDQTSQVRVYYREVAPTPVHNAGPTGTSCRNILETGGSAGNGIYWIQPPGDPAYKAYCDMTSDGGGWTAVFAGRNGSMNVFDRFDAGSYVGTFLDPASRYLRHAPAIPSAAELAISCGSAMVKFALTEAARTWMTSGTQAGWIPLTPTEVNGVVVNLPNWLWTGSGNTRSFIFARNQAGGANTFASSYDATSAFDNCNAVFDQASLVRVYYREVAPTPVHNPFATHESCRAILAAGRSAGDGIYWIHPSAPYKVYCDMTTAGGGWTAVFSGRNGQANVFDYFDSGLYAGTFVDPASRYLRRAPSVLGTQLAVSCDTAMVSFPLTPAARAWLVDGTQAGWVPLTPTLLNGVVPNLPNWLWSGDGAAPSFAFTRDQLAGANTFASSYSNNSSFDYCNGVLDSVSFVRIYYREEAPSAATVTLSGRIVRSGAAPLAGIRVTLTGATSSGASRSQARTDRLGRFRLGPVAAVGLYRITPSKPGYRFTPATRTVSLPGGLPRLRFTARRS